MAQGIRTSTELFSTMETAPMYSFLDDLLNDWDCEEFADPEFVLQLQALAAPSPATAEQTPPAQEEQSRDLQPLLQSEAPSNCSVQEEEKNWNATIDELLLTNILSPGLACEAADVSDDRDCVMDTSNISNTSKTLKTSRKRKLDDTEEGEDKPYIKKPLNAFMIFRAEQRQKVMRDLHITDSAKVNAELGLRWKMLSGQEKAPYFEQAEREKAAHKAMYPGWSAKNNLRKKARRSGADYFADLVQNPLPSQTFSCQPYPVQDVNNQTLQALPVQSNSQAVPLQTIPVQTTNNCSLSIQTSRKDKPYIKKPPNAFMLFRAEQRQRVMQELNITNSAQVNVEIGQRWKMLSELEKAPYFDQADRVRRAHEAKYPGWSPNDNLKKRARRDSITNPLGTNGSINQAVPVQTFYYEVPTVQYFQNQTFPGQENQALYMPVPQNQALCVPALQNQALYIQDLQIPNLLSAPRPGTLQQGLFSPEPPESNFCTRGSQQPAHTNPGPPHASWTPGTGREQPHGGFSVMDHPINSKTMEDFERQAIPVEVLHNQGYCIETLMKQAIPLEAFFNQAGTFSTS
ncbi:hypothetical protein WMY93_016398 [Mugilogobius chulae]|uniref:HMG box domain-containing protein n=1 Tax=Mugilogobius chulae TaxID=88201 RepID=A0AAW0P304_9GOBI